MKYIPPELPISDPPHDLSRNQANQWFDWFRSQIPTRLQILSRVVKSVRHHTMWQDDKTPESLAMLAAWFVNNIENRKRAVDETERSTIVNVRSLVFGDRSFADFNCGIPREWSGFNLICVPKNQVCGCHGCTG